jgi:hypothetical protein
MSLQNAPLLAALAASVVLVLRVRPRLFPVMALVASGVEVLRGFKLLSFQVPVVGTAVVFGALLLIGGAGSWVKSSNKVATSAATIAVFIGFFRVVARYL